MITEDRTQRPNRPILFLDFDDVLCLNVDGGYGGYDVMLALAEVDKGSKCLGDFERIWATLFDAQAKAHLRALHDEFSPAYVLSTSWTRLMDREALETTLREAGIGFVADNLHTAWETTKVDRNVRVCEIRNWLEQHPKVSDRWVALDDELSGMSLKEWEEPSEKVCIVLCKIGVGLTAIEYVQARVAFKYRR